MITDRATIESMEAIVKRINAHCRNLSEMLPPCRPERVEEVLWDWACNWQDLDISKVMAELKHLFGEQEAEAKRQQLNSGNE